MMEAFVRGVGFALRRWSCWRAAARVGCNGPRHRAALRVAVRRAKPGRARGMQRCKASVRKRGLSFKTLVSVAAIAVGGQV
jgi:hypothetical protein